MRKSTFPLMALFVAAAMPVCAQHAQKKDTTVTRTVIVEQEYNPVINDAQKINVQPKVTNPDLKGKAVEYDTRLAPTRQWSDTPMAAYLQKEEQAENPRGYARIGYGNNGNTDLAAGYLLRMSSKDLMKLDGTLNGANWDYRFYRSGIGISYLHAFEQMDLKLTGNLGQSVFNYLHPTTQKGAEKQKHSYGDLSLQLNSTDERSAIQYSVNAGLSLFDKAHYSPIQETILRLDGWVTGKITDEQLVGIALKANRFLYSGSNVFFNSYNSSNYNSLELNPYYSYDNESLKLRVGMHVDVASHSAHNFQLAPDVALQYLFADSYIFYTQATGGRILNDFRCQEGLSPYSYPALRAQDTYEQLHAAVGLKGTPSAGWWFNVQGGYQKFSNDWFQGGSMLYGGTLENNGTGKNCRMTQMVSTDSHRFYAKGEVTYQYKDLLDLSLSACAYSNKIDLDRELMAYKPTAEMDLKLGFQPIKGLRITPGYQMICRETAENIHNVNVKGIYDLFQGVSIYIQVDNLLNRKAEEYFAGYHAQGINFLGGLNFQF